MQLFLGCTDPLTAEFVSSRTGLASVAVSSKSKQLGTWRISNYTADFRETSGVGKRPVLTPDEVLRLPLEEALIIIRGKKILKVDKMDYSLHPEYSKLRSCKASTHVPQWRLQEQEARAAPKTEKKAAKTKVAKDSKATAPDSPKKQKAPEPVSADTSTAAAVPNDMSAPERLDAPNTSAEIILTDKDSIMS